MSNVHLKFIFLKTPQIRHRFNSHNKHNIFPVIRHEIYHAKLTEETYEFFGKSFSGTVTVDNFNMAIREGYVSLVIES
ncbi:hypothetical protein MCEMAEM21_00096 [Oxalobacteraceae bacterium]